MTPSHAVLALFVAIVWGVAFVVTRHALDFFSSPLLMALRFALAAFAVAFVARPAVPWGRMLGVGLTLYVGQFLFQFLGIAHGVPAGLSAVIVQSQALFTIALAALLLKEVPTTRQIVATGLAAGGLACVAGTTGQDFDTAAFLLILVSPLSFAVGNILLKRAGGGDVDGFALMAWLSLVPPLPGLALALLVDGPAMIWHEMSAAPLSGWLAVLYLGAVATVFGYGSWGYLLKRYSAAQVAPFALLVPFAGAAASWIVFDEQFGTLRLAGMILVLAGLAILVLPASPFTRR